MRVTPCSIFRKPNYELLQAAYWVINTLHHSKLRVINRSSGDLINPPSIIVYKIDHPRSQIVAARKFNM